MDDKESVNYSAEQILRMPSGLNFNTEAYNPVHEQPFQTVRQYPLSTFSVDVDTASYSNLRRYLNGDSLPPKDSVRIEEWLNYFHYSYPEPRKNKPVSVQTEVMSCPWNPGHQLVKVGLQARRLQLETLPARNVVFLLDVSGSMAEENKLPLVKAGLKRLCETLRETDQVSIVVYASATGLVLEPTSGRQKTRILEALDRLAAGGSTNGAGGIQLAYEVARRNFRKDSDNRVVLCKDGDFNVGVSDQGSLVGAGGASLVTVSKDVKLQVEFNPAQVQAYRLIGYENRKLAAEDFKNDAKDAGEMNAGHSVTALFELIPPGVAMPVPAVDPLKYQSEGKAVVSPSKELLTVKIRYKKPDGFFSRGQEFPLQAQDLTWEQASLDSRWAAAVATFGLVMVDSSHKGSASFELAEKLASSAIGPNEDGLRKEMLQLISKARELSQRAAEKP